MKNKDFDAVEMMRDIRKRLSKRYASNPKSEDKDLARIRAKYKMTAR